MPSEDDIYTRFQTHFDNGVPFEIAEEEISRFVGIHNLEDIEVRWEGELDGYNFGRVKRSLKYHKRQLDDNLSQIKSKEEAINMLKEANKKHEEIIKEFEDFVKKHEIKE